MPVTKGEKQLAEKRKAAFKSVRYSPGLGPLLIQHMSMGFSFETFNVNGTYIPRTTMHRWIQQYPEFREAKEIGLAASQHCWEKRGMEGMEEDKFKPALWAFNMKNRFKWTDRTEVEQNITGNVTHSTLMQYLKGDDLKKLPKPDDDDIEDADYDEE